MPEKQATNIPVAKLIWELLQFAQLTCMRHSDPSVCTGCHADSSYNELADVEVQQMAKATPGFSITLWNSSFMSTLASEASECKILPVHLWHHLLG